MVCVDLFFVGFLLGFGVAWRSGRWWTCQVWSRTGKNLVCNREKAYTPVIVVWRRVSLFQDRTSKYENNNCSVPHLSYFTYTYMHTYVNNCSLQPFSQDYDLVSHVTYFVCVHFYTWVMGPTVQQQIFEKLFMANLFTLRVFARNLLRGSRRRNILFIWRCLTWGLNRGLHV